MNTTLVVLFLFLSLVFTGAIYFIAVCRIAHRSDVMMRQAIRESWVSRCVARTLCARTAEKVSQSETRIPRRNTEEAGV